MDAAQKTARIAQIRRELPPLRNSRDDNVRNRNRSVEQIEDLRRASTKLRDCLNTMGGIRRKVRDCHNIVEQQHFSGIRRREVESRLGETSERVRLQQEQHVQNRERIERLINTLRANRDELNRIINVQNNRITALETELRGLW